MEGQAMNHWRGWDLTWDLWVPNPAVFLSHCGGLCRVSVVTWSPEGGAEVKARGGARVVRAVGSVGLGVGLRRWRAGQAGFWGCRTRHNQEIGLLSAVID